MIAKIWWTPRSSAHRRRVQQDRHVQPCEPRGNRQDFHMGHASMCNNRATDHKQHANWRDCKCEPKNGKRADRTRLGLSRTRAEHASDQPPGACGNRCRKASRKRKASTPKALYRTQACGTARHRPVPCKAPHCQHAPSLRRDSAICGMPPTRRKAAMNAMIWGKPRSSAHRRRVQQDKHVQPCEPLANARNSTWDMQACATTGPRTTSNTPTGATASASPNKRPTR